MSKFDKAIAEIKRVRLAQEEERYGYERQRKNLAILRQALEALGDEAARGRYDFAEERILLQAESMVRSAIRTIPDPDEDYI